MMKLLVFVLTSLIATTLATIRHRHSSNSPEESESDRQIGGHGACKPPAPAMKNLQWTQFAGLWYIDSSSSSYWGSAKCNTLKYHWRAHKFTHDNRQYNGYYNIDEYTMSDRGRDYNYVACAFARNGYMHGFLQHASDATELMSANATSGEDPCHPHFLYTMDVWVMKSDYKQYALAWLCNPSPYVMILSRDEKGLSKHVRHELEAYLHKHGYNNHIYVTHNDCRNASN